MNGGVNMVNSARMFLLLYIMMCCATALFHLCPVPSSYSHHQRHHAHHPNTHSHLKVIDAAYLAPSSRHTQPNILTQGSQILPRAHRQRIGGHVAVLCVPVHCGTTAVGVELGYVIGTGDADHGWEDGQGLDVVVPVGCVGVE